MTDSILNHNGTFSFSSIDTLLTQFKIISQEQDIQFRVYKKILTVMIESLENLCKYNDSYEDFVALNEKYHPSFELTKNTKSIKLKTINPVQNKDVVKLKRKIDKVNNKTKDELKQLYVETISNGKFSDKGGAGLGFIEMAKTSGNNLEYSFEKITEDYSLYTFIVTFTL